MSGYFNEARNRRVYEQRLSYVPMSQANKFEKRSISLLYQDVSALDTKDYIKNVLKTAKTNEEVKERLVAYASASFEKNALKYENRVITPYLDDHSLGRNKPVTNDNYFVPNLITILFSNLEGSNPMNNAELYTLFSIIANRQVDSNSKVSYEVRSAADIEKLLTPDILDKLTHTLSTNRNIRLSPYEDTPFGGTKEEIIEFLVNVSSHFATNRPAKNYFFDKADLLHQIAAHNPSQGPTLETAIRNKNEILEETLKNVNDGRLNLAKPLTVEDIQTLLLPKNKIIDPYLRDLKSYYPALNDELSKCVEKLTVTGSIIAPLKFGDAYMSLYAAKQGTEFSVRDRSVIDNKVTSSKKTMARNLLNMTLAVNDMIDRNIADGKKSNVDDQFTKDYLQLVVPSYKNPRSPEFFQAQIKRNADNALAIAEAYSKNKSFVIEHGKLKVEALTPKGSSKKVKLLFDDYVQIARNAVSYHAHTEDTKKELIAFIKYDVPQALKGIRGVPDARILANAVKNAPPKIVNLVTEENGSIDKFAESVIKEYKLVLKTKGLMQESNVPYADEGVTLYDYEPHVPNKAILNYKSWKEGSDTKIWIDGVEEDSPAAVTFNIVSKLFVNDKSTVIADLEDGKLNFNNPQTIVDAVNDLEDMFPLLRDFMGDKKLFDSSKEQKGVIVDTTNNYASIQALFSNIDEFYSRIKPYYDILRDSSYHRDANNVEELLNYDFKGSNLNTNTLDALIRDYGKQKVIKAAVILQTLHSIACTASMNNYALEKLAEPLFSSFNSKTVHKTQAILSDLKLRNHTHFPNVNEDIFEKGDIKKILFPVTNNKSVARINEDGKGFKAIGQETLSAEEYELLAKRTYSGQQARAKADENMHPNTHIRGRLNDEMSIRRSLKKLEFSSCVSHEYYTPSLNFTSIGAKFFGVEPEIRVPTATNVQINEEEIQDNRPAGAGIEL